MSRAKYGELPNIIAKKYNLTIVGNTLTCNVCGYTWKTKKLRQDRSFSCPNCHPVEHGSSAGECELYDLLATSGLKVEHNNRTILNGKELDIYFPEYKIAIEYDGKHWHDPKKDEIKNQLCAEKGIKLLRIDDEEWNNKHDISFIVEAFEEKGIELVVHPENLNEVIRTSSKSQKVICTDTMEIFNSAKEAAAKFSCLDTSINAACNGTAKNYKGYHFQYFEEGKKYKKTEVGYAYNKKKVKCIETGEVFWQKDVGPSVNDCLANRQECAYGYHWERTEEDITEHKLTQLGNWASLKKPIICVETGKEYPSTTEAAKEYNVCKENLHDALKHGWRCAGLHWKYKGKELVVRKLKQIICIETGEVFNGLEEAMEALKAPNTQSIQRVCSGERDSYKGKHLRYL